LLKLTPQELARISTGKNVSGTTGASSNHQNKMIKFDGGLQRGGSGTAGPMNPLASVLNNFTTRSSTSFKG
jgi:hypothetical protein